MDTLFEPSFFLHTPDDGLVVRNKAWSAFHTHSFTRRNNSLIFQSSDSIVAVNCSKEGVTLREDLKIRNITAISTMDSFLRQLEAWPDVLPSQPKSGAEKCVS